MDARSPSRPRPTPPFDLDAALAVWRRGLANDRALLPDDLDELEQHVRDHVAARAAEGVGAEAAYREAIGAMDFRPAEEYRKVYWGKAGRGAVTQEARWRLTLLRNYAKVALRHLTRQKGYAA